MPTRTEHPTHFQSGQQTNARGESVSVQVRFRGSMDRNAGKPDPLVKAMKPPAKHQDGKPFTHSKTTPPRGSSYKPAGAFGKPKAPAPFKSKATNTHARTARHGEKSGHPFFKPR